MRVVMMIEGQEGVSWAQWIALARAAEDSALDGLFRSDHYSNFHSAVGGALDAWTTIAGLAAITHRIRLGTLVSPVTFRPPSLMARIAASADHISGGRIELGLGTGWHDGEHSQNGFPFPPLGTRFDMLVEQVEVITQSWRGEAFSFEGQHYTLKDQIALPRPLQEPHPPLIIGGLGGPRSLALAANHAQEYNSFLSTPDAAAQLRANLDTACEKIGRDPKSLPLSAMGHAVVGESEADARARQKKILGGGARASQTETATARMIERTPTGDVQNLAERFAAFGEVGVTRLYLQNFQFDDMRSVSLLGELAEAMA